MKIAIIGGAGGIGSSAAFNLLRSSRVRSEVIIIDNRPEMITSHVMDLGDIVSLGDSLGIRGGVLDDAVDADIVMISAAVPLRLNTSRSVFLIDNAKVVQSVLGTLMDAGFAGRIVMLTNPVDPLLTWAHERYDIPAERIVGYTLNDCLRLRTGISQALEIHPSRVDAWVIGEHGEHQVPLYSRVRVDGEPAVLHGRQQKVAQDYVDTWYTKHVALDSGRTSTWSSGLGGALMVEAMTTPEETLFPASCILGGEYGVSGVSLNVPVLFTPDRREVQVWDISAEEAARMPAAAAAVREATDAIHAALGD